MSTIEFIPDGSVTSPRGFQAGAAAANIRGDGSGRLDIGLIYSERPATAAAVFTTNQVKGAAVIVTQRHLSDGRLQAIISNSGNANTATGDRGLVDAEEMTELAAERLRLKRQDVAVTSTGVIGRFLPMMRIREAVPKINVTHDGGLDFARAIMTTDTRPKHCAVRFTASGQQYTLGGVAKGAGMIHPNMATMHCFITTDAPVDRAFLGDALRQAVDVSFNMIDIDGDMSTSDTVMVLANGMAGGPVIDGSGEAGELFREALTQVCVYLAKAIAADGEGATKLITVEVNGAASAEDARRAARHLASSLMIKTAVYGADPNWGRIIGALGASGAAMEQAKTIIYLGDICVYRHGSPADYEDATARAYLGNSEVTIRLDLGLGEGSATAWGCDITEEYVRLNSEYTT